MKILMKLLTNLRCNSHVYIFVLLEIYLFFPLPNMLCFILEALYIYIVILVGNLILFHIFYATKYTYGDW